MQTSFPLAPTLPVDHVSELRGRRARQTSTQSERQVILRGRNIVVADTPTFGSNCSLRTKRLVENVVDDAVSRTLMQPEITTASKSNQCEARDRTYAGNKIAEYQQKSEPRHMYRCYLLKRRVDLHILAEAL